VAGRGLRRCPLRVEAGVELRNPNAGYPAVSRHSLDGIARLQAATFSRSSRSRKSPSAVVLHTPRAQSLGFGEALLFGDGASSAAKARPDRRLINSILGGIIPRRSQLIRPRRLRGEWRLGVGSV